MAIAVEQAEELQENDLDDLCEATADAIREGIGFDWVRPPERLRLAAYWRGVLLVPQRILFLGRLNGTVVGSVQLVKPAPNNEAGAFAAEIDTHFVAPWARGHGLARALLEAAEAAARRAGFSVIRLDVRETQDAAINLYESNGYVRWGTLSRYALVNGAVIAGHYYFKDLDPPQ